MKRQVTFLFVLCLCGCELVVNVDTPFKHAQLVVNSFFTPDSLWSAEINLNRDVLDDSPFQKVDNALAVIYENDVAIDTLKNIGNGRYLSVVGRPLAGIAYEIKVSASGYDAVSGKAEAIPSPAMITHVDFVHGVGQQGDPVTTLTIKFQDDPAEANYYQVVMEEEADHYDYRKDSLTSGRYIVMIEPTDAPAGNGEEDMREEILRSDVLFNGKNAEISFKARTNLNAKGFFILLRTLTEDYYKYKTTSQLQDGTDGDPFAQPVNVFNNINNGFGIFAGYNQSAFVENKPQPQIISIEPKTGKAGDHFVIKGNNFSDAEVSLDIGDYPRHCEIVNESENEIEAVVPVGAVTGRIVLNCNGYILVSDDEFVVE